MTYRLWGIDAPEVRQVCPYGWPAGSLAATRLQTLTAGEPIVCQEKDRDLFRSCSNQEGVRHDKFAGALVLA